MQMNLGSVLSSNSVFPADAISNGVLLSAPRIRHRNRPSSSFKLNKTWHPSLARRRRSVCLVGSSFLSCPNHYWCSSYGFCGMKANISICHCHSTNLPCTSPEEKELLAPCDAIEDDQLPVVPGPDEDDGLGGDVEEDGSQQWQFGDSAIFSACFVGLFTGISVVIFNYTVHEIRELSWDGISEQGASWLREQPLEAKWAQVIFVPAFGGLVVSMLKIIQNAIDDSSNVVANVKSTLKAILNTLAACVTLGTGNSLGPEGPSVEIGVNVAKGVGSILDKGSQKKLSLRAAGSAAGISSGFNAAVAGCFFAVESVLWPSPEESSLSITNATSMVILSAVIASVISEVGLGSQPAFSVPVYDFRSPSELPLYLLLGVLCGLVSLALTNSTSFLLAICDDIKKNVGIPGEAFPIFGGLAVGSIALAYPEILYWGFQNVDLLLESRPFTNTISSDLLLQVLVVKIFTTSLSRACGLVGGYYAPSLFIGAATGMAYGKIVGTLISDFNPIFHLSVLEVASPQAYGLVGMAATLSGVCQVPLTAVLLLFELTQDYRIVLPLLGAVGLSSWITTLFSRKKGSDYTRRLKVKKVKAIATKVSDGLVIKKALSSSDLGESNGSSLCDLESTLCLSDDDTDELTNEVPVSEIMRRQYVTVLMSSSLSEVVSLMLENKQSFAVIVDKNNHLIGQITLSDIQKLIETSDAKGMKSQVLNVSKLCSTYGKLCHVTQTITPDANLFTALTLMNRHNLSHLPVVIEHGDTAGSPIGILDRQSVDLARSALIIRDALEWEKLTF